MEKRANATRNVNMGSPSLLLAILGFAASTTTVVGLMTVLGSLA